MSVQGHFCLLDSPKFLKGEQMSALWDTGVKRMLTPGVVASVFTNQSRFWAGFLSTKVSFL